MNLPENHTQISASQLDSIVQTLATTIEARDSLQNILDTMVNAVGTDQKSDFLLYSSLAPVGMVRTASDWDSIGFGHKEIFTPKQVVKIADRSHAVLVVSRDATIRRANRAACALLGYEAGQLPGTPVDEVLTDERPWKDSCMIEVANQGAIRNREVWFTDRQGKRIPVLFSASSLRSPRGDVDGYVCAALDISEHVRLRAALQSSRESFHAIVEKSADGILILGDGGVVDYLNPSAMALLGRDEAEMIGMPFGFPVVSGNATEVDVVRKNGDLGIAEMRAVKTIWNGGDALLVSLRDVTENVHLREQLRQLSMEDELTGLNNRRGFLLLAEQELRSAERCNVRPVLFFLDLDGMKRINDTLGHRFGDQALIETASIMRRVFRRSDILCRLGGDEFLALSLRTGDEDRTSHIVARLDAEIERRNSQPGRSYQLSVSVGSVAVSDVGNRSIEALIREADAAMYHRKAARKAGRAH